jgi:PAS domain S-box-containing protein
MSCLVKEGITDVPSVTLPQEPDNPDDRSLRLALDVIAVMNRDLSRRETVAAIVRLIRRFTGLQAAGVRLRAGEEYPLYVHNGFSDDFVRAVNGFCRTESGAVKETDRCVCLSVMNGDLDRHVPSSAFTANGSFITNNGAEFTGCGEAHPDTVVPPACCCADVHESVALIPLRREGDIIGLLHLSDPVPGRMSLSLVELLEEVSDAIGAVLARAEAEKLRRLSEDRLAAALDDSGIGIWEWDLVTRHVSFDHREAEKLGYIPSEETKLYAFWEQRAHPEDLARAMAALDKGLAEGVPQLDAEIRIRAQNGDYRWYLFKAKVAERDPSGAPTLLRGTHLDIHERKLSEEALRESEARFRAVYESEHVVMLLIDPETTDITDGNPGACAFYDMDRDAIRSVKITDINTLPAGEVQDKIRMAVSGERRYFEFKHRAAGGEIKDVQVCTGPITIGGKNLLYSIVFDATPAKQAERALKESEERVRAVVRCTTDAVYIKDRSFRYVLVNPSMIEHLDRTESGIIGSTDFDLFDERDARHQRELDQRVLEGEIVEEEHSRTIAGTRKTFLDLKVPLRDNEGNVTGIVGVSRDITDRSVRKEHSTVAPVEHYESEAMQAVMESIRPASRTDSIVLLTGESGVGKDYLARYLHDSSLRADGPYYSINCAAVAPEIAESELFGHEAGAFTGAKTRKRGLLELAEGGTLLLNEIGDLSPELQAKLLTFLDTRSFMRVGGEKSVRVNARLIVATNKDLEQEVTEGRFRRDLYYRLQVISIRIPPLRRRKEDIPVLARRLIADMAEGLKSPPPVLDREAEERLCRYSWPGNVRELKNVLERALILSGGSALDLSTLGGASAPFNWSVRVSFPLERSVDDLVNDLAEFLVREALRRADGKRQDAAALLNISRHSLKRRIKALGITD